MNPYIANLRIEILRIPCSWIEERRYYSWPCTTCHLVHLYVVLRRGGTINATVTSPRQYSRDLPQGGLELPCTYRFTGKDFHKESASTAAQQ